jgi:hypothetical protein
VMIRIERHLVGESTRSAVLALHTTPGLHRTLPTTFFP